MNSRLALLLALILVVPGVSGQADATKKTPPKATAPGAPKKGAPPLAPPAGTRVLRDLAYVADGHERQKLDLYLPAEGRDWPLLVWIHGGGWQNGSKDRCPAVPFVARGYAVASLNYRLSAHAVFPAQIEDCKAALRWLRAHAKQHGYDPGRIAVWGSSAGGHLVAMLAVTGDVKEFDVGAHPDQSSRVQAVVDFFGPTDLGAMQAQTVIKGPINHDAPDSPEAKLIGGALPENRAKAARASPITYVSPGDAPILIMHGDQDPLVPVKQSETFHAKLQQAGVDSTLHIEPGAGHSLPGPHIQDKVAAFLDRHLRPKKP